MIRKASLIMIIAVLPVFAFAEPGVTANTCDAQVKSWKSLLGTAKVDLLSACGFNSELSLRVRPQNTNVYHAIDVYPGSSRLTVVDTIVDPAKNPNSSWPFVQKKDAIDSYEMRDGKMSFVSHVEPEQKVVRRSVANDELGREEDVTRSLKPLLDYARENYSCGKCTAEINQLSEPKVQ